MQPSLEKKISSPANAGYEFFSAMLAAFITL
jgi:hypothetical protein